MVVKIRLSRFGKRHQPIYNIVVSQARYGPFLLSPNPRKILPVQLEAVY
jgi:hypothetical protein